MGPLASAPAALAPVAAPTGARASSGSLLPPSVQTLPIRAASPGAATIQRFPDGSDTPLVEPDSVTAEGTAEVGAPNPAAAEPDIEKLADRVWQVVRRKLALEKERRRGLP